MTSGPIPSASPKEVGTSVSALTEQPRQRGHGPIAIIDGTIHEHYLKEHYQGVTIIKAPDADAAIKSIATGEADAFFNGAPYSASIIKGAPIPLTEPIRYQAEEAPIGFVIREGDQRKEQIDGVIEDMILTGQWLKIKTDYFESARLSEVFREKGA